MTWSLTSLPSSLPTSPRALLARIHPKGHAEWRLHNTPPPPAPGPGHVLIRTTYVGLNPFDWQSVEFRFGIGLEDKVVGRDGAGVVVAVGAGVDRFNPGDRVWFCANTATTGAFQTFSVHPATEVGHTPPGLLEEQAATLGTGLVTAGVTLFRTLNLPLDITARPPPNSWFLVWGGSGITGIFLIQLARLLGYRVICCASPVNHAYVRSLGAEVVLDRWAAPEDQVEAIRLATGDNVRIAVDNVGRETAALCHRVLQGSRTWPPEQGIETTDNTPGKLVPLAGAPRTTRAATTDDILRPVDILRISFSTTFYNKPEFSAPLLDLFTELLGSGQVVPARTHAVDGGLDGIVAGLDALRHGRSPGGYKLVARVDNTSVANVANQTENTSHLHLPLVVTA